MTPKSHALTTWTRIVALAVFAVVAFVAPARAASVPIQEVTSPGGIKAWLVRDDKLPLIALHFAFRGGVEQDAPDKQGLAVLAAALLTEGAGPYDAAAFQQKLADQSIQLGLSAGRDALEGDVKTLRATRGAAFDLLRLALTQPRFDAEAIERLRGQQLTRIKLQQGDPEWQARRALFAQVFGDHSYGQRQLGSPAPLGGLTRDDVRGFAARHLARDNLVVAVAGDIAPDELAKALDYVFGALPAAARLAPVPDFVASAASATLLVPREGTQTQLLFTRPMPRRDDPDWYAAEIVNYILGGGGFTSRLMREVRAREGLTYGISTGLAPMDHASLLMGQAAADNPKAGRAYDLVMQVWRDLYRDGATADEIQAAKDYLTGALPLRLTSTEAIADILVAIQLQHLGIDYLDRRSDLIRAVSAEDVQRVIRRWFAPEPLTWALVGEPEGITPTFTQEQTKD